MPLLRFIDAELAVAESSARVAPRSGELREPDASDVARLRDVVGTSLVSILAATTPGPRIEADDLFRLSTLLAEVERRLRLEHGIHDARAMADRCRSVVVDLVDEPMGAGLGLYIGPERVEAFRLPHTPIERVVIDPNFATRELEFAAQVSPTCRVLVAGEAGVRCFVVRHGEVIERLTDVFPVLVQHPSRRLGQYLDGIAEGLKKDLALADLPTAFIAPRDVARRVCERAHLVPIGIVDCDGSLLEPTAIRTITQSLLTSLRIRECDRAFDKFDDAVIRARAAVGPDDVWDAVRAGRAELVIVDPTFAVGAVVDPVTHAVSWVEDPSLPGVVDDLVDEMIELTMLAGGSVVFSAPGGLGDDHVAAVTRDRGVPVDLGRLLAVAS